ncbi:differentially expressed in FDCP 8 homolog [Aplysia californica]|uniref:Differentially expressed in FDCP 8 homolog n=1 Tax=Aplysia californica TaxID=6500 RepID=A0ABM0JDA7_APLCA|nr:differentially expressed in FDCP 8 homolog [Aplysia californica]
MSDLSKMRYVNTSAATVKMTGGIPFVAGNLADSDTDEEDVESHETDDERNRDREQLSNDRFHSSGDNAVLKLPDGKDIHNSSNSGKSIVGDVRITSRNSVLSQFDSDSAVTKSAAKAKEVSSASAVTASASGAANGYVLTHQTMGSNVQTRDAEATEDMCTNSVKVSSPIIPKHSTNNNEPGNSDSDKTVNVVVTVANTPVEIPWKGKRSWNSTAKGDSSSDHNQDHQSSMNSTECSLSPRLSQSVEDEKMWETGNEGNISITSSKSLSAISSNKGTPTRSNPFNRELLVDEDHFSDTFDNYFKAERKSTGSTKSSSMSHGREWWHETVQPEVSFAELGLSEDHFSHPQGHFGLSDVEELELAIDNCKELIREAAQGSDKQKNLVLKLVQLRIKLQEIKEGPEPVAENVKVILSHKMMLKSSRTSKYYCEKCNGSIWGMLQAWYRCTECGYRCHEKCLQQILRTCAKARVLQNPTLIMDLCPREPNGLASQSYRCGECRSAISFKSGMSEPRMCDYSGRYYCEYCHWNDSFVIPARVLHNWDFTGHKVCRASKQFLKLMQHKAVIRIQDINPMLFVYVDQLNEIKKLREEMMIMKKYILSCPSAMAAKLLLLLAKRQHFVECSDRYSMQDLLDAEDVLVPELVNVHSTWAQHIKVDCELCQGRGFCCELCGDQDILFPFDSIAVVCAKCSNVLHRHCFSQKGFCPRCVRREKRKGIVK